MNTSNAIIFTLLLIFLTMGFAGPLISEDFNTDMHSTNNEQVLETTLDFGLAGIALMFINIIFIPVWTFGLPLWLNLTFMLALRIVFLIAIIDKYRGLSS